MNKRLRNIRSSMLITKLKTLTKNYVLPGILQTKFNFYSSGKHGLKFNLFHTVQVFTRSKFIFCLVITRLRTLNFNKLLPELCEPNKKVKVLHSSGGNSDKIKSIIPSDNDFNKNKLSHTANPDGKYEKSLIIFSSDSIFPSDNT